MSRPPRYERHANAALIALPLQSAQLAVAPEIRRVGSALLVRPVVGGEDHERVLVEPLLLQLRHYLPHVGVETRYHSGELRVGVLHRVVARAFLPAPRLVHEKPLLVALQYLVVGLRQFGVGQGVGQEAHEGMPRVLLANPFQCLVVDDARRVLRALEVAGPEHRVLYVFRHHLARHGRVAQGARVAVQEIRIVQVGLELADVSVKLVNATLVGR